MGFIYKISNIIDDRVYVGSTINLNKRWNEHKRDLIRNKHFNNRLQNFVNKYGINSLKFEVIEEISNDILLIREQYYIDKTKNKFNIANNSSAPMMGKSHSIEAIRKIAIHSKGSNNPMYGKKRPQWLINMLTKNSLNRTKSKEEKIKRLIVLSNRKEIIIFNNNEKHICFSISHAAKIINISQQSISKALNNNYKSKGWTIIVSNENFYNKDILLKNIHLFDDNGHPQPELISMLKSLKK